MKKIIQITICSVMACLIKISTLNAQALIPPLEGAYQGAFMDFGATASDVSLDRILSYHQLSGKKAVWSYFANDWIDGEIKFPKAQVEIISQTGIIPYIRMMPWSEMVSAAKKPDELFELSRILSGEYDLQLIAWLKDAQTFAKPLMIEFGPEVNGEWFPWNGKWNGGATKNKYGDPNLPDGPERFRDTYRHIINLSRKLNIKNITWVFHVDSEATPASTWNEARFYYPGDDYIDWIGISVFGKQLPENDWLGFDHQLADFQTQLRDLKSTKPWLIAEAAVIEDGFDRNRKAQWIHEAYQIVESGKYKNLKGFCYWHSAGWLASGRANMRVDSSPESLKAFQFEIQKPFWKSEPRF